MFENVGEKFWRSGDGWAGGIRMVGNEDKSPLTALVYSFGE